MNLALQDDDGIYAGGTKIGAIRRRANHAGESWWVAEMLALASYYWDMYVPCDDTYSAAIYKETVGLVRRDMWGRRRSSRGAHWEFCHLERDEVAALLAAVPVLAVENPFTGETFRVADVSRDSDDEDGDWSKWQFVKDPPARDSA